MDHLDKIQQNMVNLEYPISQSHLQKSAFLDQVGNNNILEKTICKNICKQPKYPDISPHLTVSSTKKEYLFWPQMQQYYTSQTKYCKKDL